MADNADIAGEAIEHRLQGALANRLSLRVPNLDPECEDCGQEIPQARREAAPWATTCIECQGIREKRRRHVR